MSALPPITDVGRHIPVSIWLSVYEYTPLGRRIAAFALRFGGSLLRASPRADFWKQPAGIAACDRLLVVGRQTLEGCQVCNHRSDCCRRHERKNRSRAAIGSR